MRKIIISFIAVLSITVTPIVTAAEYYTTWCGITVLIPDKEALENVEENIDELHAEIDEAMCGKRAS